MKKSLLIFTAIATVILLFGHFVLYVTWISLFGITDPLFLLILAIVLGLLGISFTVTSIIVYWDETIYTSSAYAIASGWLGASLYITMATVLGVLVSFAQEKLGWNWHPSVIALVFLAIALAYATYGMWNAFHPRVKRVTVRIPNLPDSWHGKKVVQLSDVHLGPIHRYSFTKRVVGMTNRLKPDAVFITGDLFDGGGIRLGKMAEPLGELQSTHGTFFITGNHETYVGVERALNALKGLPITILRDHVVDLNGLQLLGIDYPGLGEHKDIVKSLQLLDRSKPNIVLYHEPKFIPEFKAAGANLVLAGHTHYGQLWPLGYITRRVYKGYEYGLHAEGPFNIYISPGVGTWGPMMRTGNHPEIVEITLEAA